MSDLSFRDFASRIFYNLKPQPNQVNVMGITRIEEELHADLMRAVECDYMRINFDMTDADTCCTYFSTPKVSNNQTMTNLHNEKFRMLLTDLLDQQNMFNYGFTEHNSVWTLIVSTKGTE